MHLVWWAPLLGVGYVLAALLINVAVWVGLLRLFDAVGRRRAPNLFIAVRQLSGRKSGFLSVIGLLSILGVSFSSCSLDTVLSVMGGFQEDLKHKIVGSNAHVVVDDARGEGIADYPEVLARVRAVPRVVGATPLVLGEALVQSPRTQNLAGALVRGIDPASVADATDLREILQDGAEVGDLADPLRRFRTAPPKRPPGGGEVRKEPADRTGSPGSDGGAAEEGAAAPVAGAAGAPDVGPGADIGSAAEAGAGPGSSGTAKPPVDPFLASLAASRAPPRGIFIGAQLADTMNVRVGDELNLVSPMGDLGPTGPMPRSRAFTVAGIFHSGMYEYDTKHVYIVLAEAQRFFGLGDVASQIAVRVTDLDHAGTVADTLRRDLPSRLRVLDWQSINKGLFAALKLEKVMMFVMLSLAILVASFSIISTLTLMVFEKHRQIALLKALGTTDAEVRRIFNLQGAIIGLAGAITGSLLALTLCLLAKYVVPFPVPKEVFYISRLPVALSLFDFLVVGLSAVVVSVLSTTYPSAMAARLRPADGLRQE